jgi:O-antigen ligase
MSFRDILRFTIIASFFATPFICLYVANTMFFPFITGKNFTFRILVEIMLGAWALLMFIDASYRPKFTWILGAAGAFLAVIALADFLGVNPYRSFWSNYERMEGLVAHIHLFLYFIIAGSVLKADEIWRWFWRTSLGVSLMVAYNAFAQLQGWGAVHQSSNRLDATFGNSVYLAMYALFSVFIATFLFFREGKEYPRGRFVYLAIAIINVAVMYYTQTRGTLLGLVGGVFLALLLAALFDREHPERKKYALGGVIGVVILIGAFIAGKDASWIQENRTLSRMANISLTDPTTISRFMIWRMSWEGFKEHPILGVGQDNFLYVFSKHYDPDMYRQEPWFDRSHNVFFDWLTAGGSLGLLSYLSLFAAALYYIWRRKNHHLSVVERAILTGMLAGYFIHNIFVFDNITSYLIFFALLAYLHAQNVQNVQHVEKGGVGADESESAKQKLAGKNKPKHKESDLESGDLAIAGAIIIAMTVGVIYFMNTRNINANIALIKAIRPEGILVDGANGKKEIAIEAILDQGLFGSGEAREQLAQIALQTADPRVPAELRQQFFDLTASEFEQTIADDPTNLRTISFAAAFYMRFGQFDKALTYFKRAIDLSPRHQGAYLDLSQMLSMQGKYQEAEEVAKVGYELAPAYGDAALSYAIALVYQKKIDEAGKVLAPFAGSVMIYDSRLVNAYGNSRYYDKVIEVLNEKIAKGAASGRDYFSLAGAYSGLNNNAQAAAMIEKAISLDAGLKDQGEQMLKELRGGK